MKTRLIALEQEVQRLREINEQISLTGAGSSPAQHASVEGMTIESRSMSPSTGVSLQAHSLIPIQGEKPPREDSISPGGLA
jgi:hypothetical protein